MLTSLANRKVDEENKSQPRAEVGPAKGIGVEETEVELEAREGGGVGSILCQLIVVS